MSEDEASWIPGRCQDTLQRAARDRRLTLTELRLLVALALVPYPDGWLPLTQREMAEGMQTQQSHIGRALGALQRLGYIERARVPPPGNRYAYWPPPRNRYAYRVRGMS